MKKGIVWVLICCVLMACLTGCGGSQANSAAESVASSATATPKPTSTPTATPKPTPTATPTPSPTPTPTPVPVYREMTDEDYTTAFNVDNAKVFLKSVVPLLPEGDMTNGLPITFAKNILEYYFGTDFIDSEPPAFLISGGQIDDEYSWRDLTQLPELTGLLGISTWYDDGSDSSIRLDGNKFIYPYRGLEHFFSELDAFSGEISENEIHLDYSLWLGYDAKKNYYNGESDWGTFVSREAVFKRNDSGKFQLSAVTSNSAIPLPTPIPTPEPISPIPVPRPAGGTSGEYLGIWQSNDFASNSLTVYQYSESSISVVAWTVGSHVAEATIPDIALSSGTGTAKYVDSWGNVGQVTISLSGDTITFEVTEEKIAKNAMYGLRGSGTYYKTRDLEESDLNSIFEPHSEADYEY